MENNGSNFKFIFCKTPQKRHGFRCHRGMQIFPVIRSEQFEGTLLNEVVEFIGKSASGTVSSEDFRAAVREGYVEILAG